MLGSPRVAVVMDGSRRHYDVALALSLHNSLERMYTDWYSRPKSIDSLLAWLVSFVKPQLGRRMSERFAAAIPNERVYSNPLLAIQSELSRSRFDSAEAHWQWVSTQMGNWVRKKRLGDANGLYGFIRNIDPMLCRHAREDGVKVVGEQMIAPAAIEVVEHERQCERWPDWEGERPVAPLGLVQQVEEETWAHVDRIVAPSEYVRQGLVRQGVDKNKIDLVPYPADFDTLSNIDRSTRKGPPRVGFVGHVNLRKNAPLFMELAKRMAPKGYQFEMVGKSYLSESKIDAYRQYVQFAGAVPRSEVANKLASFDVFLFPSTCEGSAGVVIEAMATGLPIVTTPNSGSPVEHCIDGLICESNDMDSFEYSVELLCSDRSKRLELGVAAAKKVASLTLLNYGKSLLNAFRPL